MHPLRYIHIYCLLILDIKSKYLKIIYVIDYANIYA